MSTYRLFCVSLLVVGMLSIVFLVQQFLSQAASADVFMVTSNETAPLPKDASQPRLPINPVVMNFDKPLENSV